MSCWRRERATLIFQGIIPCITVMQHQVASTEEFVSNFPESMNASLHDPWGNYHPAFQGCRWGLFRPAAKSGNRVFKWFALHGRCQGPLEILEPPPHFFSQPWGPEGGQPLQDPLGCAGRGRRVITPGRGRGAPRAGGGPQGPRSEGSGRRPRGAG